jgi:hypothetical protein
MDRYLREAWTHIVLADDLDAHMAAVGQAQANAALVGEVSPFEEQRRADSRGNLAISADCRSLWCLWRGR